MTKNNEIKTSSKSTVKKTTVEPVATKTSGKSTVNKSSVEPVSKKTTEKSSTKVADNKTTQKSSDGKPKKQSKLKGVLNGKIKLAYSLGQLGWALLASLVASQLTTIWTEQKDIVQGTDWKGFIPVAIFSIIFALSKVFDAISDPIVGRFSDKFRSKWGRRIPFMGVVTIPFGIISIFVFVGFDQTMSVGAIAANATMLVVMLILFYVCLTIYTIPYTSLISDLSKTSEDRVSLSMLIAVTYFLGSLLSYGAPTIWTMLYNNGLSLRWAIITTMGIFSLIAMAFLITPVLVIKEKDFVDFERLPKSVNVKPLDDIKKVLSDKKFRWFILADLMYWIGLITFQAQVNSIVKDLLGIDIQYGIVFVGVMSIVSFALYGPISILMNKIGVRKIMMQISFLIFTILFTYGAFLVMNRSQLGSGLAWVEGLIFVSVAGVPMAVLGIVENVVVSDVIEYNKRTHDYDTTASFYAVRNLTMKMGQAIGMGLGALLLILGNTSDNPLGIRMMLAMAAATSLLGAIFVTFYEESRYRSIRARHKALGVEKKYFKWASKEAKILDYIKGHEKSIKDLKESKNPFSKLWMKLLVKELAAMKERKESEIKEFEIKRAEKLSAYQIEFDKLDNLATEKAIKLYTVKLENIKKKLAKNPNAKKATYLEQEIEVYTKLLSFEER